MCTNLKPFSQTTTRQKTQLHENPFHCDCRLLDFSHWVSNSGIPRTLEPVCHMPPRLSNRTLVSLDLSHDLACLPQVEAFFYERRDPKKQVKFSLFSTLIVIVLNRASSRYVIDPKKRQLKKGPKR